MKATQMRRLYRLAVMLGLAAGVSSAASVGFGFAAANMGGAADSQVLYYGTITNNDVSTVFLTSESVAVNGFTIDDSAFTGSLAGPLGAGASTGLAALFAAIVPSAGSNPYGTFTGSYSLLGGANPGDTDLLASASFVLQVVPTLPSDFLSLDPSTQTGWGGQTLLFSGTITNAGVDQLFLNGADLSAPFPLSGDASPFLASPLSLNGGTFEFALPLFTVAIPPGTPDGLLGPGTLSITGGADGGAQDNLGSADFSVNVVAPEPGSMLLGGIGVMLLAAIRRRS